MAQKDVKKILGEVEAAPEDPDFFPQVFTKVSQKRKEAEKFEAENLKRVMAEEYGELSRRLDKSGVQESVAVRNVLRTRRLANLLIDEQGHLNEGLLPRAIQHLEEHLFSLGPKRQFDAKRHEHLLSVLTRLRDDKKARLLLRRIGRPFMHKYADQIIRDTLQLSSKIVLTDAHARRAALSAWMCLLRQSVGSCFATAPAIIVHKEQPEVFLQDLIDLLGTGRLVRTFEGIQYAVPLSYSWGAGDLRRMFLLSKEMFEEKSGIWLSPGLEAALEVAGVFDEEKEERTSVMKRLILGCIGKEIAGKAYIVTTMEVILRKIMLRRFSLTEEDIEEYEARPKGMIHGGLLMTAGAEPAGGKGKRCAQFLEKQEDAQNAFKALADNALLKSWEFTVASFAETKAQFTRWNLYSSLGLGMDEKGGIGPCLYQILNEKLQECNRKVHELQYEYEIAYQNLQILKNRLKRAVDEAQAKWFRSDYQAKANEFYTLEEMRNKMHFKAKRYANLFSDLIELYYHLFPKYFQEIYDADMHEVTTGPYDDSPAGFRLLYKHGRENTAQWTRINNHIEFTEALAAFFTASEREVEGAQEMQGLEDDISEITTAVVNHVRTKEFIESAFLRMAKAHNVPLVKDPLDHLDQVQKKPWVYTSGGAMTTLVSCYFKRSEKPTELSRWVENPLELLTFFVDALKKAPEKEMEEYVQNPDKGMLMHSPTHAFLLKPGLKPFQQAWKSGEFTYTWLRDNFVLPMKNFTSQMFLDREKMQFIIDHLLPRVPKNQQPYFKQFFGGIHGSMLARDFRDHLVDSIRMERGLQYGGRGVLSPDEIDSALYSLLPLFPSYQFEEKAEKILKQLSGLNDEQKKELLLLNHEIANRIGGQKIVSSKGLQDILKAMLCLVLDETSTSVDYPFEISRFSQELGFSLPTPVLFADTNWVKDEFAFAVNPGTAELELWRMDYTGSKGAPMSMWKEWLDGSQKEPDWGIYIHPYEYKL